MEGVPQLPMLSALLKTTAEKTDFSSKIRWQIREHFNEDPNSYVNEIRELEGLRAAACHPPIDFTGCSLLKKYYCQLHFLQNRFKFDDGGHDEILFLWNDIYTGMSYSTGDIKHEMACILYNIGALHTILGSMDNRQTADGLKMSCSHFQCAAWAFQHLNEKYPQIPETDLCSEITSFLATVSLAQAQECILQKSIVDGRKAGIVSKVAAQIVDYYKSALKILLLGNKNLDGNPVAEVVGSKIFKSWKKFCEFKLSYHHCVCLLYMGISCEELQKMGDRVAYFQLAMEKLGEATKLSKQMDRGGADDAIQFVHDVVGGKLKAAEKENEFIYHEKVPDKSTLPEIKGASLVKGTPFDVKDPEVSGQDIFHRLVPMEAHEASSLYSEEKAKLLRQIGASIDEKDQELDIYLTSLQLDQLKLHSEPQSLPQDLVDHCAAFCGKSNAVETLVEAMSKLSSVYTDVEANLNEAQQLLNDEQENEKLFQSGQGKRPPSMILKELSLEVARFKESHAKAAETNMQLHKSINAHLGNLRTLSLPLSEIQAQLPSLQMLDSTKDQAAVKELQRLLDKVDEMRKQRVMLYTQLREALQADDITKLATHTSDLDALFAQELSKHQRLLSLIEPNLSAQEKILNALTEANARYADTRQATVELQKRRTAVIAALLASAEAYSELMSRCEKGLEFYRKLDASVTKVLQRLRSVCRVQQEEREQQQEAARMRTIKTERGNVPSEPMLTGNMDKNLKMASEGPKLRDFLHLMKKDRNVAENYDIAPVVAPTLPQGPVNNVNPMPVESGSYNYPNPRPNPLGAEPTEQPSSMNNSGVPYQMNNAIGGSLHSSTLPQGGTYDYRTANAYGGFPLATGYYPGTSTAYAPPVSFADTSASLPVFGSTSSHSAFASGYYQPMGSEYSTNTSSYPVSSTAVEAVPSVYPPSSSLATSHNYSQYYNSSMSHPATQAVATNPVVTVASTTAPPTVPNTNIPGYTNPHVPPGSGQIPYSSSGSSTIQHSFYDQYYSNAGYNYSGASSGAFTYPTGLVAPNGQVDVRATAGPTGTTDAVVSSASGYQHGFATTSVVYGSSTATTAASNYGYYPTTPSGSQYLQYPYYGAESVVQPGGFSSSGQPDSTTPGHMDYYRASTVPLQPTQAAAIPPHQVGPTNFVQDPTNVAATTSAPIPAPSLTPAPSAVPKPGSNLELLSLLDLSVPSGSSSGILEPVPQAVNNGTWKETNQTTNTVTVTAAKSERSRDDEKVTQPAPIVSPTELPLTLAARLPAPPAKDPLTDPDVAAKLATDVEKFDKLVDGLTRKSLNGPTPLDVKWKEVQELQDKESAKRSISVARCYPMKNRFPDVLPYDHNRIELPTTKDDYINASQIGSLSSAGPSYIVTQCPLPCTQQDFWTMLWERQVEIVVCLLSDAEIKGSAYWPTEKGRDVVCGRWIISLQSTNTRPNSVERILTLTKQGETKQNRVLIHLQFTSWPGSSFPSTPVHFLNFASELLHFWKQQRNATHPVVVHCLAGAGRTGLLCITCTALADLAAGHGIIDVVRVAGALCQQRRNMFRDREHLLFTYQTILYHAQDLLMKRGILSGKTTLQGSPAKVHHSRHPSQDFIDGPLCSSPASPASVTTSSSCSAADHDEPNGDKIEAEAKKNVPETGSDAADEPKEPIPKQTGALAILDPANFNLDASQSPSPASAANRNRVTKDSFLNVKNSPQKIGASIDPNDPLSQLDPLWSLTK